MPAGVAGLVHLHGAVRGGALHRPQHPAHRHRCQDLQRWHSSPSTVHTPPHCCRAASLHWRGPQEEDDEEQPAEDRHHLCCDHLRVYQPVQGHPIQVAAIQISTYLHTDVSNTIYIANIYTGDDTTSPTSYPTDRTSPLLIRPSTTPTSRYTLILKYVKDVYYAYLKCFCNFLKSCEFMMIGKMEDSRENLALTFLYMDILGAVIGTNNNKMIDIYKASSFQIASSSPAGGCSPSWRTFQNFGKITIHPHQHLQVRSGISLSTNPKIAKYFLSII